MMRKVLWAGALAVGGALAIGGTLAMGASAQSGSTSTRVPLNTANDTMLTMFEQQFTDAAKAMPADKYDFTPASVNIPGAKFDGVRSFADEVKHVAQANFFFYSAVGGMKPTTDVNGIDSLKTKNEILNALAASFAFGHKALATLTTANEGDPLDIDGLKTKGTVAAFAVAHGFDHYGQMVEYLRMKGIAPPGSK